MRIRSGQGALAAVCAKYRTNLASRAPVALRVAAELVRSASVERGAADRSRGLSSAILFYGGSRDRTGLEAAAPQPPPRFADGLRQERQSFADPTEVEELWRGAHSPPAAWLRRAEHLRPEIEAETAATWLCRALGRTSTSSTTTTLSRSHPASRSIQPRPRKCWPRHPTRSILAYCRRYQRYENWRSEGGGVGPGQASTAL